MKIRFKDTREYFERKKAKKEKRQGRWALAM
jgi:hypothetical protein